MDFSQEITDLQIKATFAEDLLDSLNETVARHEALLAQQAREIRALRDALNSLMETQKSLGGAAASAIDELPPHY